MQWSFAEEAAAAHGQQVDRRNWRVVMSFHLAETREQARIEARQGLQRWHNEYIVGTLQRPGAVAYRDPDEAVEALVGGAVTSAASGSSVIGTPDDLVAAIRQLQELTGGFGTVIGFAHDWANRENTLKSWDLLARYVVPEINGFTGNLRRSQQFVATNRGVFERAQQAVLTTIGQNERAAEALAVTVAKATAAASDAPQPNGTPKPNGGGKNGIAKPKAAKSKAAKKAPGARRTAR